MSIEYITEAEYERRFIRWSRGRKPLPEAVKDLHADRIRTSASALARCFAKGEPHQAYSHLRGLLRQSKEESLRREFQIRFSPGLTGPDRNCIGFMAEWKDFL